jgi:uncharacterized protein YdhG (YjbR/CyaY superfamily)
MPSKPTTIEAYLIPLTSPQRAQLEKLRQVIRKAVPNAEEIISYSMPAFRQEGIVVWYAGAKNHYAVYVYPRVKMLFTKELVGFKGTKSSIHFEYGKPVPVKLITAIVKESLRQNLTKASNPKMKKLKAAK